MGKMGFTEIYGQKRAIELLKAGFRTGRISHAYLFYGPSGVGKAKTAVAFAQLLNCERSEEAEPCNRCSQCYKIALGNHPDVEVIKPDGASIKIEQMRNMQEKVYFKCYEGKFKVIMIEDAHLMTVQAANSLLKVLEEPPAETVFILLAEELNLLPITIQSRCLPVSFAYLSESIMGKVLSEMGIEIPFSLALAQGSLGKALDIAHNVEYQEYWQKFNQIFADIKKGGYHELFSWAETIDKEKKEKGKDKNKTNMAEIILEWLTTLYRDRIIWFATGEKELLLGATKNLSHNANAESITDVKLEGSFKALEEINKAVHSLKNNGNCRLTMEVLFVNLRNIEQRERGGNPND